MITIIFNGKERETVRFFENLCYQFKIPIQLIYDNDVPYGNDFREAIPLIIDNASIVFVLISIDFIASDFCTRELKYALEREKTIIPIFIDIKPSSLSLFKDPYPKLRYIRGLDLSKEYIKTNPLCRL